MNRNLHRITGGFALVTILIGISFYANFRPIVVAGYPPFLVDLFAWNLDALVIPEFALSSFPSFIFVVYMCAIGWTLLRNLNPYLSVLACFLTAFIMELLQATPMLHGVFDLNDLLALGLGALFSSLLIPILKINVGLSRGAKRGNNASAMAVLAIIGSYSLLGSMVEEWDCTDSESSQECVIPIFLTYEELRRTELVPVYGEESNLNRPGKVYVYQDMLMISDQYRGIHIFDNTDKENPVRILFLPIKGSTEISITNDVLYTNSYVDLLAIELLPLLSESFTVDNYQRNQDYFALGFNRWDLIEWPYQYHPGHESGFSSDNHFVIGYEKQDGTQVIHGEAASKDTVVLDGVVKRPKVKRPKVKEPAVKAQRVNRTADKTTAVRAMEE